MKNEYLKLNEARCKDCYACIRACPVKAIGFANSQANIIADECVLCGNCYVTCPQNAKRIREDVPTVRDAIRAGKRVVASVAPSFPVAMEVDTIEDMRDTLKKLGFADAEETAVGALRMMEEHALDGVDAIYGVHVWGTYDAPGIAFPAGNLMACCHGFTIEVEGKSAHASAPHEGVDAVMVASSILQSIQQLVSRMNDPLNPLVITVGKVTAGNRWNVLAGHATLEGTVRTFLTGTQVEDALRKVAECTAAAFGAKATLSYQYMTEPVINGDEQLNRIAQTAVTKLYGKESLITPAPLMGSEDFSWFGKDGIPYIYGFVASHNKDWDYMYGNHHEKYDVDETILHRGAAVAAQFAADYLAETAQQ